MQIHLLKSKLHCVRITWCDLFYEGSLAIDQDMMDAAGLLPYERILVVNRDNGQRLETYAIPAARGSKTIGLNGAAARSGHKGDVLTIMSFAWIEQAEAAQFKPQVAIFDDSNNELISRSS